MSREWSVGPARNTVAETGLESVATRARLNPIRLSLCALLIAPTLDVDLQLELAAAGKAQAAARESAPRAQSQVDLADLLLRQFREAAKAPTIGGSWPSRTPSPTFRAGRRPRQSTRWRAGTATWVSVRRPSPASVGPSRRASQTQAACQRTRPSWP